MHVGNVGDKATRQKKIGHELPSTADQVRVRQSKVTDITLVARVDFRWVTLELPGVSAQMIRSNIRSLRQKQHISIQLQPWQQSEDKIQDLREK